MLKTELGEQIIEYNELEKYMVDILFYFRDRGTTRSKGRNYLADFITMDIETSTIGRSTDNPIAFTYSIAVYIAHKCILFRRWEEYVTFIENLAHLLGLSRYNRLVCYVHNLPYEFQFMRNFMHIDDVFAVDKRKVVKCHSMGIEYRCSYKLTNMGLARFTESTPNIVHGKLSGDDFDYNKMRTPNTELTPSELDYIFNDVAGLYEALEYKFSHDKYNLANVPITSTGYVRNILRNVMQENPKNREIFLSTRLDQFLYGLLRASRRGGNTHCVPIYSCMELEDLDSDDMTSAYPAVMVQCKFPMTPFVKARRLTDFEQYTQKFACILDVTFYNLKIKTMATVPYIPKAHCTQLLNIVGDNGRVLSGEAVSMVITDIDYNIIKDTYTWTKVECRECYCSHYDYLPIELRKQILKQFYEKTTYKDKDPYLYMKKKNEFNADFGCMLTDICQDDVEYVEGSEEPFRFVKEKEYSEQLDDYYSSRKSFLSYQHGGWVTAHCRRRLQKAIDGLGSDMVYCDTDSAKYFSSSVNRQLFDELNKEILQEIEDCGLDCTVEYKGKKYTLGIWEPDGHYEKFKSMGAKKYCYIQDGEFSITVAGLSKSKARDYLETIGGIDAFEEGTLIPPNHSGRTAAKYNDWSGVKEIKVGDETILVGSNLVISDTTYQFTLAEDYETLLTSIQEGVIF